MSLKWIGWKVFHFRFLNLFQYCSFFLYVKIILVQHLRLSLMVRCNVAPHPPISGDHRINSAHSPCGAWVLLQVWPWEPWNQNTMPFLLSRRSVACNMWTSIHYFLWLWNNLQPNTRHISGLVLEWLQHQSELSRLVYILPTIKNIYSHTHINPVFTTSNK